MFMVRDMVLKYKLSVLVVVVVWATSLSIVRCAYAQDQGNSSSAAARKLTLTQAAICENIKDFAPVNQAIVFSIATGKVSCFTAFDPVPEETVIYHNWFHRDKLSKRLKLSLYPPRWSSFSGIQLREADQGPWRVEITDQNGRIIHLLRFSITD
jgi:hypothetical protein